MLLEEEKIFVYSLVSLIAIVLLGNIVKKDKTLFFSPLTIVSLIFLYYTIIGPILSIVNDTTVYKLIDHRPYYIYAWKASLMSFICLIIGFNFKKTHDEEYNLNFNGNDTLVYNLLFRYGKSTLIISVVCLIVLSGVSGLSTQLNVFSSNGSFFSTNTGGGILKNYFMNGMNFLMMSSGLFLILVINDRKKVIYLLIVVILSLIIYTKLGFRWRHVVTSMSLFACYHLYLRKKVNLMLLAVLALIGIVAMGFIGVTRNYGAGLNTEQADDMSTEDLFLEGFGEASVFMTTGLLIHDLDSDQQIGLDPIIQSITMPIPREIWPGKPSGDYLDKIVGLYDRINPIAGLGVAITNFGEYYLMYGYTGVVIGSFLLGLLLKSIWNWFLKNRSNPFAIIAYSLFFGYLYVVISRGYLPQVFMLFMFTVFPAYYIFRKTRSYFMQNSIITNT